MAPLHCIVFSNLTCLKISNLQLQSQCVKVVLWAAIHSWAILFPVVLWSAVGGLAVLFEVVQ
jgi:hypothetical protein